VSQAQSQREQAKDHALPLIQTQMLAFDSLKVHQILSQKADRNRLTTS
jgi:hypothetical protein